MTDTAARSANPTRVTGIVICLAIAWVVLRAVVALPGITEAMVSGDNDDMMRLLSVRAWLAGQPWFDMTQYRILPPEGISMHWSRLVDLAIAAIIVPASWVVPMARAEQIALVAWPTLQMAALVTVVGIGTRRKLGALAACTAVLSLLLWLPTGNLHFNPGHIDHHSVQILMMTVVAFCMIGSGPPLRRGIIAGVAAAASLAVGLEMLALVVVAGGIMAVRAPFGGRESDRLLAGFCATLALASALFFAGQTDPATWFVPYCDALAPPVLSVTLIAAAACLVPMAARGLLPHPALGLMATAAIAVAGLWLCWPLLQPCLAGPYGKLPPEVQAMMTTRISEAQPGLVFATNRPLSYNAIFTPVAGAIALAALFWITRRRSQPPSGAGHGDAVLQMILLGLVGLIGSFFQVRMVILAACAVPFLTGYVFLSLLQLWQARPRPGTAVMIVICAFATLLAPKLEWVALRIILVARGPEALRNLETLSWDRGCRSFTTLAALDDLPPARILTTLNLGTPLIFVTHHSGLTAPYHRSASAFWNGVFPFQTAAALQTALTATRADYVLLCRKANYGDDFPVATGLLRGDMVAGLQPVPFDSDDLAVFRVAPAP